MKKDMIKSLVPPTKLKLAPAGRSRSKCESCVNAQNCKLFMPSVCGEYCPPLGYFGAIQFDTELARPSDRTVIH